MSLSPHSCKEQKCSGPKYGGLRIKCHDCHEYNFIECIEDRKEIEFLLQYLDITVYNGTSKTYANTHNEKFKNIFNGFCIRFICINCNINGINGDNNLNDNELNQSVMNEVLTKVTQLKSIAEKFNVDFDNSFKEVVDTLQSTDSGNTSSFITNTIHPNVNTRRGVHHFKSTLSATAPPFSSANGNEENETMQNNNRELKKIKKNAGLYEIYVAKFNKNEKSENITQRICQSLDGIDSKMFNVQKVGGLRKHHTFASFKVSTFNITLCKDILSMNWDTQKAQIFSNDDQKNTHNNNHRENFHRDMIRRNREYGNNYFSGNRHYNHSNYRHNNFRNKPQRRDYVPSRLNSNRNFRNNREFEWRQNYHPRNNYEIQQNQPRNHSYRNSYESDNFLGARPRTYRYQQNSQSNWNRYNHNRFFNNRRN